MTVARFVVLGLTAVSALAVLFFLIRSLGPRLTRRQYAYGVAHQEARHEMQVNVLRAGFMFVVTLILLGIYGLIPAEGMAETTDTPAPKASPTPGVTITATAAIKTTATPQPTEPSPSPTELTATQTLTATATLAATDTPEVPTAIVNSPNGLWLREAPGGTQEIELIAHESPLQLLPGRETADDLEWQQVRTQAGNEGWVAVDFIEIP